MASCKVKGGTSPLSKGKDITLDSWFSGFKQLKK